MAAMAAADHPSYGEELEHCRHVLGYVETSLEGARKRKEIIDKDIDFIRKHYNPHSSTDYTNLTINTLLKNTLDLKLRNLITALGKPYFARIDFTEEGADALEKLYIGKMSLMRDEDQEVLIVDWRAPIANLYYEGRLGHAGYLCPDGTIHGELSLKRQFSINGCELQQIFDIDITTNDEFLQSYLGANAGSRLKEIVSTIQEEQNRIIRSDMWRPLVVQGAAGSGKTTIALHRIAYLIYSFEKTFKPENFMIVAPNKLFLNYISEILPELGVERVRQTTFEEFASDLVGGKRFKLRDPNEKLLRFIAASTGASTASIGASAASAGANAVSTKVGAVSAKAAAASPPADLLMKATRLKSSFRFKEVIDLYLDRVERSFIPHDDFMIAGNTVFAWQEIESLFLNDYRRWPVVRRMHEIRKHMNSRLVKLKEAITNSYHDKCDSEVMRLKQAVSDGDERRRLITDVMDERDRLIGNLDSNARKAVSAYVAGLVKLSPIKYYTDMMRDRSFFAEAASGFDETEALMCLCDYSREILDAGQVEIEDLAPLIYIKYRMYGIDEKMPVKHIVIDEAQDFSVFQLYVLKKIIKDSSFTLLGDLCQGIHSYRGVSDWRDVMENVFPEGRCEYLTLEQSYRTTVEIMEAANSVISALYREGLPPAKPVIRHGRPVETVCAAGPKAAAKDMAARIKGFYEDGYKSVAVIAKTAGECMELRNLLKKDIDGISLITGRESEYRSGTVVVPAYLSKGLEFDCVLLADVSEDAYPQSELDMKLLYVSMTRALHSIVMYHYGKPSRLLSKLMKM